MERRALEIDDNPAFQQRDWRAQRIGWGVLAVVVLGAFLGFFGQGGLLGDVETMSTDRTIYVRYERFVHRAAPSRIEFRLAAGLASNDGQVRLWLDRGYMESLSIEEIQPEPTQVSVTPALLIYSFAVVSGGQPVSILFSVEHQKLGRRRSHAGVLPQGMVTLRQFVYP